MRHETNKHRSINCGMLCAVRLREPTDQQATNRGNAAFRGICTAIACQLFRWSQKSLLCLGERRTRGQYRPRRKPSLLPQRPLGQHPSNNQLQRTNSLEKTTKTIILITFNASPLQRGHKNFFQKNARNSSKRPVF